MTGYFPKTSTNAHEYKIHVYNEHPMSSSNIKAGKSPYNLYSVDTRNNNKQEMSNDTYAPRP